MRMSYKQSIAIIFILLTALSGRTFAADPVNEDKTDLISQGEFEQQVKDRLTSKLNLILDQELYRIIVNAKVKHSEKKIVLSGETSSESAGTQSEKKVEEALPGFQMIEKAPEKEKKVQQANKSKFKIYHFTELLKLDVHLLVDNGVAQDKRTYVETILKEDLDAAYGDKASLQLQNVSLTDKDKTIMQRVSDWFTTFFYEKGGEGVAWLFYITVALLFLLALIPILRKIRQIFKAQNQLPVNPGAAKDKNEDELEVARILNAIVEKISSNTLQVSCFLKQLTDDEKTKLLAAVKTPAMKRYFQQLMNFYDDTLAHSLPSLAELKNQLQVIEQDLERFLKIQLKQEQLQFGYLPLLEQQQIKNFINGQGSDALRVTAILSKFLSKDQFQALTGDLNTDQRVDLFKLLHSYQAPENEIDALDEKLRTEYKRIRDYSAVLVTGSAELEKEFLENDLNVMEVLERLDKENFPLGSAYEKYKIKFSDLNNIEVLLMNKVLDNVSNETLAKAFAKSDISGSFKKSLGDMRGKLISSMRSRYTFIDNEEVKKAQVDILKTYWNLV